MAKSFVGVQRETGCSVQRFSPAAEVAGPSLNFRENQSYRQEVNFRYMTENSNSASLQSNQHEPQQEEALYLGASPSALNADPPLPIGVHRLPVTPMPLRRDAIALPHNVHQVNRETPKIRQIHIQILTEAAERSENRSSTEKSSAKLLCSLDNNLISLDETQNIINSMTNVAPVIKNIFGKSVFPNTEFQCTANMQSTEDNLTNLQSKIMELSKINKIRLLNSVASGDCVKVGQRPDVPPVSFEPSDTHYTQRMLVNYSPVTPPTEAPATSHLATLLDDSVNVKLMHSNYKEKLSRAIEGHNNEETVPVSSAGRFPSMRAGKMRRQRKSQNKNSDSCEARNITAIPNQYYVTHADRNFEIRGNTLQHCERPCSDGQRSNVIPTEYMTVPDSTYTRQQNNPNQMYRYFHPRFNGYVPMDMNTNRASIQQQQMIQRAIVQECEGPPQQHYRDMPPQNGSWVIRSQPAQMPNVPETWQNSRHPSGYVEVHGHRPNNNMYYTHSRVMHDPDI